MRIYVMLSDALSRLLMLVAGLLLCAMAIHIFLDVVGRQFFNAPLGGTIEIVSKYYMVAVTFLPLAYAQWRDSHLTVDFVAEKLPATARIIVDLLVLLISLGFLLVYAYVSLGNALDKMRIGEFVITQHLDLAVWPSRWFLVIGVVAMALIIPVQIVRTLNRRTPGTGSAQADAHHNQNT